MISLYQFKGAGEDDFENYDLEKLLLHTGGRGLAFMDQYKDEADAAARGSARSNIAVSGAGGSGFAGAGGSGFAGAASTQFGATTKSQFKQAEGRNSFLYVYSSCCRNNFI